jgi:hypothetical protein
MDRNAVAGAVVAQSVTGVPLDCHAFLLEANAAGATAVGAFPVIDLDLGIGVVDLIIIAELTAQ